MSSPSKASPGFESRWRLFSIDVKHDKNDSKTTVVCFVYEIAEIKATAPRTALGLNLVEEVFLARKQSTIEECYWNQNCFGEEIKRKGHKHEKLLLSTAGGDVLCTSETNDCRIYIRPALFPLSLPRHLRFRCQLFPDVLATVRY
jgi:hypothetical protein